VIASFIRSVLVHTQRCHARSAPNTRAGAASRCAPLLALTALATGQLAHAQDFPARPLRYIVPSSPGSAVDTIGRIVAPGIADELGQPVLVENRAGAGGNIGAALVARAAADGHTLLQINNNHTVNVTLYRSPGYDLMRDFQPVSTLAFSPYVLVVHTSLPVKSLADLIGLARKRPGAITYATAGAGSGTFMSAELFRSQARLDMLHVPYVGGGPALASVIAGETLLYGAPLSTALPHLKSGRLRALAVTSAKRVPLLPAVPAVGESIPGFEFNAWAAILLPVRTSPEIAATVHRATGRALGRPELARRLGELGYVVAPDGPAELSAFMRADISRMATLIRENGLTTQ
jgi:tripartite-type tricarboxylate transporter receptor subunit TctC